MKGPSYDLQYNGIFNITCIPLSYELYLLVYIIINVHLVFITIPHILLLSYDEKHDGHSLRSLASISDITPPSD